MDVFEARRRLRDARSAVLATVDPQRGVHLVPVVFTLADDRRILIAVDSKPKRSRRLRRIANIETDPRVSLLVEHYESDWEKLWWVRVDGRASVRPTVEASVVERHRRRYPQLESHALGPWIDIEIDGIAGWSAI